MRPPQHRRSDHIREWHQHGRLAARRLSNSNQSALRCIICKLFYKYTQEISLHFLIYIYDMTEHKTYDDCASRCHTVCAGCRGAHQTAGHQVSARL